MPDFGAGDSESVAISKGSQAAVQLRFRAVSDSNRAAAPNGFYIDNLKVEVCSNRNGCSVSMRTAACAAVFPRPAPTPPHPHPLETSAGLSCSVPPATPAATSASCVYRHVRETGEHFLRERRMPAARALHALGHWPQTRRRP
jgi:hypothetical protein